jgi:hypothetical protein
MLIGSAKSRESSVNVLTAEEILQKLINKILKEYPVPPFRYNEYHIDTTQRVSITKPERDADEYHNDLPGD